MGLLGLDSHNPEEARLVHHLAGRGHPLLYLAPLGVRDPGPGDLLRGLRRLRRASTPARPVPGMRTARLLLLPWRGLAPVAALNRHLVRRRLHGAVRALGGGRPVLWLRLPTPELVAQLDAFRPRAVVYECIDDYSAYPQYGPSDRRRLARYERQLAERADLVITLTSGVAGRFPGATGRVRVLPLGAELARFSGPPGPPPADLARLPRPRLGLVGGLDGRVDFDLLGRLARARPDWSVVLIGPLIDRDAFAPLAGLPNVHLLGRRAYEQVPGYLAALDLCLIPYRRSAWTAGCFPAKLHEYLAAGRPVVATELPGLADDAALTGAGGLVDVAPDAAAFLAACRRALDGDGPARAARRRAHAVARSLETRCETIDDLLLPFAA
jgi:glycosyltransferase involved in cell wall biosynthesis